MSSVPPLFIESAQKEISPFFKNVSALNTETKSHKNTTILQLILRMAFGTMSNILRGDHFETVEKASPIAIYKRIRKLEFLLDCLHDPILDLNRKHLQSTLLHNIQHLSLSYFGQLSRNSEYYDRGMQELPLYQSLTNTHRSFYDSLKMLANVKIFCRSSRSVYLLGIGHLIADINEVLMQFTIDPHIIDMLYNKHPHVESRFRLIKNVHKAGADLNYQDQEGLTLLHKADQPMIAELLLNCGASPDVQDKWGDTPLHIALSHQHSNVVKILCDARANVEVRNILGQTPIFRVLNEVDLDILIKANANKNAQDNQGNTPLHVFTRWSYPRVLRALCTSGVQFLRNSKGQTALEYARNIVSENAALMVPIIEIALRDHNAKEIREKEEAQKKEAKPLRSFTEIAIEVAQAVLPSGNDEEGDGDYGDYMDVFDQLGDQPKVQKVETHTERPDKVNYIKHEEL